MQLRTGSAVTGTAQQVIAPKRECTEPQARRAAVAARSDIRRLTGVNLRVTERGPVAPLDGQRKKLVANPESPYAVLCHIRGLQLAPKLTAPNRATASRRRGKIRLRRRLVLAQFGPFGAVRTPRVWYRSGIVLVTS